MLDAQPLWHPAPSRTENQYVAFRAKLRLPSSERIIIRIFGCDLYRLYMDNEERSEGPARFAEAQPEYDEIELRLEAGEHTLAVIAHYYGVPTRMTANRLPAFLQAVVLRESGRPLDLTWQCRELDAYLPVQRRVNGQLGWTEHCDTRLLPEEFAADDAGWVTPGQVQPWPHSDTPHYIASDIRCMYQSMDGKLLGEGCYVDRFGYEKDDPPVRFMLRDLHSSGFTPDGVWYRFDFGKIGLYRPVFSIEAPEGAVVETGYSESLTDARVVPVISLSASSSCHMDRWVAKGGEQTLSTYSYRGFRYLELHIAAPAATVRLHGMTVRQRSYFGLARGSFESSDPLLNRIWILCAETLQSCSEDALTDTPVRERGQWLGDAVTACLEVANVAYGDLTLIRRSLEQAALCRREDGMIVGCYPGQIIPVSSYAMLWISSCMRYYGLTGDIEWMRMQHPAATEVVDFYLKHLTEHGVQPLPYWDFLDWGHMVDKNEINVALNVLVWKALNDLGKWSELLGDSADAEVRRGQLDQLEAAMRSHMLGEQGLLRTAFSAAGNPADSTREAGFHANTLALKFGWFRGEERAKAVELIKQHMLNCFPNRQDAPRLAHPRANHPQLITPYFAHFSLSALLEEGETAFVYDQIRRCWGWMLEQGATTLLEVFDPRWSHCHAWSGCPAWQLSYYALGLHPRGNGNPLSFQFGLHPESLEHASGLLPVTGGTHAIRISWRRKEGGILYECECEQEMDIFIPTELPYRLRLLLPDDSRELCGETVTTRSFRVVLI